MYYIEKYESKNGWRFRIKANNGRIIADSENYESERSMNRTISQLKKNHNFEKIEESIKNK